MNYTQIETYKKLAEGEFKEKKYEAAQNLYLKIIEFDNQSIYAWLGLGKSKIENLFQNPIPL
jgi:hypothetical protein